VPKAYLAVSAAPHRPAGHFSPKGRGAGRLPLAMAPVPPRLRSAKSATTAHLSPFLRGEDGGSQVRGSASGRRGPDITEMSQTLGTSPRVTRLIRAFRAFSVQPIVWPVLAQSARNCASPLSVSGWL